MIYRQFSKGMDMTGVAAKGLSDNAIKVLKNRYLLRNPAASEVDEDPEGMFRRVAANVSRAELNYLGDEPRRAHWEATFFDMMARLEFLPNSPTLMNAGTELQQLAACFVLPVPDSIESIFESVKNAALIHKSGGGTGFSFSSLRPADDVVGSTRGVSSGPVSFISVFDAATEAVKQGGRRRGANMAILRVDHPDIARFVEAKKDGAALNNFNMSVAVTDTFMDALVDESDYGLLNPRSGEIESMVSAKKVFTALVESAWRNGEPGIVFIDEVNRHNPTPNVGEIAATNPCGEQPLLPYESCNLGSLNVSRFVTQRDGNVYVDYPRLETCIHNAVRFLDDVIDMNRYPIKEIERITKANRKIGLGVMGFADLLIRMKIPYDSHEAVEIAGNLMQFIQKTARAASHDLAMERGAFANFAGSEIERTEGRLLRNATTTTIAPTGTIGIIANTSSGIEPLFAVAYVRTVMDGQRLPEVNPLFEAAAKREGFYSIGLMQKIAKCGTVQNIDEVPERWRKIFRTAHDIDPAAHIRIQAAFQEFTDNAVSKTINFPHDATVEDVEEAFSLAHKLKCKGLTIYRDGSRDAQVLTLGHHAEPGGESQRRPKQRPRSLRGTTKRMPTGCGHLYVTVNDDGKAPFELFAQMGKAGGCAASQSEAIGRLVSLSLRAGVDPPAIVKQLRGVRCPVPAWEDGKLVMSCADAISKALEHYLSSEGIRDSDSESIVEESAVNRSVGQCVDCGHTLEFDGGCSVCRMCGYSRCG